MHARGVPSRLGFIEGPDQYKIIINVYVFTWKISYYEIKIASGRYPTVLVYKKNIDEYRKIIIDDR